MPHTFLTTLCSQPLLEVDCTIIAVLQMRKQILKEVNNLGKATMPVKCGGPVREINSVQLLSQT